MRSIFSWLSSVCKTTKVRMPGPVNCLTSPVVPPFSRHDSGRTVEVINSINSRYLGIEPVGSFGATMKNIAESLDKMAAGMRPVIDTEVPIDNVASALTRMESRQVFGKIIVTF